MSEGGGTLNLYSLLKRKFKLDTDVGKATGCYAAIIH